MQGPFGNSLSHIVEARSATIKQPPEWFRTGDAELNEGDCLLRHVRSAIRATTR
jgi:hypothetical protein